MKLQQLRYIWEVAHHELNVSQTAQSLYTSQPGISKQIRLLEDELGIEVFCRSGKHLTDVTPAGEAIIQAAGEILRKIDGIKQVAQEFSDETKGSMTIATTHTQGLYALPAIVKRFHHEFPDVNVRLHQGTPMQIAEVAADGIVDFAIASEGIELFGDWVSLPAYQYKRSIVVPKDHPLTQYSNISLSDLVSFPLVTYVFGFSGRCKLEPIFARQHLVPKISVTATDAEMVKTYVKMGMGVGIIPNMAYDEYIDGEHLVELPIDHLLNPCIVKIGCRRGAFLRGYMYNFIEYLNPKLTRDIIQEAFHCHSKHELDELYSDIELPLY